MQQNSNYGAPGQAYGQQQGGQPMPQTVYVEDRDKDKAGGIGCCGAFREFSFQDLECPGLSGRADAALRPWRTYRALVSIMDMDR